MLAVVSNVLTCVRKVWAGLRFKEGVSGFQEVLTGVIKMLTGVQRELPTCLQVT